MLSHSLRKQRNTSPNTPDKADPAHLPVEPDEGPVPSNIPEDPESDRVVDPEG